MLHPFVHTRLEACDGRTASIVPFEHAGRLEHAREQIGDIICREEEAFVFVLQDIAPFVCRELTRVRHIAAASTSASRRFMEKPSFFCFM